MNSSHVVLLMVNTFSREFSGVFVLQSVRILGIHQHGIQHTFEWCRFGDALTLQTGCVPFALSSAEFC